MTAEILKNLLALQAAVQADDGDKVVSTLSGMLERQLTFEAGELVLSLAADLHRRKLTHAGDNLVQADVLGRLASHATALRIDDRDDARHLPETLALLEERGWRSLLAIPMAASAGLRGAVILVARPACAFAGAPLGALGSLVTGAGLSLHHALKLSGQHDEVESLRSAVREERAAMAARVDAEAPLMGERQALAAEVSEVRRELARLEDECRLAVEARARADKECLELQAQRDAWKSRALAAEERSPVPGDREEAAGAAGAPAGPAESSGVALESASEPVGVGEGGTGVPDDAPALGTSDPNAQASSAAPAAADDPSTPPSSEDGMSRARRRSRRRRR